jgi:hypothetical protein
MFRFTIRDVLWLTVVVALGVGWSSQQTGLQRGRAEIERQRTKLAAKRAELEQRFMRIVDMNDRLNTEMQKAIDKASK